MTWLLVKEVEICMNPLLSCVSLSSSAFNVVHFAPTSKSFRDESLQFVSKKLPIVCDAIRFGAQVQVDPRHLENLAVLHLYFEEGVLGG